MQLLYLAMAKEKKEFILEKVGVCISAWHDINLCSHARTIKVPYIRIIRLQIRCFLLSCYFFFIWFSFNFHPNGWIYYSFTFLNYISSLSVQFLFDFSTALLLRLQFTHSAEVLPCNWKEVFVKCVIRQNLFF